MTRSTIGRVLLASGLACTGVTPPPGTSIGAFTFSARYVKPAVDGVDDTVEDPLAGPELACVAPGTRLPRCDFPGGFDDLRFDAVLSYEASGKKAGTFYFRPGSDETRVGELKGVSFTVVAPRPVGCALEAVPREINECESCRVTSVEWIRGELLEREPEGGCTPDVAGVPVEPFDPASFGAVCGTLTVRVDIDDAGEACPERCRPQDPASIEEPPARLATPVSCAIVFTLTGTRA